MFMKHIGAVAVAGVLCAVPALAQDHSAHAQQGKLVKGTSLALEACVTPAENREAFVLAKMKEHPAQPVETGLERVYRFNSGSYGKFSDKVGQMVRIEGRVEGIEEGKIDYKPGKARDGGLLVEFEVAGRDVDTTPAVAAPVGTSGTAAGPKPKITLIKVKVDKVTAIRACG